LKLEVEFGEVTEKNIGQLKLLNSSIFPVQYQESFYKDLLQINAANDQLTRLAYYNDILVGAVSCRIEKFPVEQGQPSNNPNHRLYIMTLGVLAPYRTSGIGFKLLQYVLDYCKGKNEIDEVYLHVQTSNDNAIEFYKRAGFLITETIKNYYKRIEPPDCYVLKKKLH